MEVHWFDPAVQKIHIAHLLFCAKKAGQETGVSVCLLSGCYFFEQLALRAGDTLSYPRTRAGLSSMAFPPRGIRISDGRSCCDFRPRRQRYPLRSVHSDNPLCVITSSHICGDLSGLRLCMIRKICNDRFLHFFVYHRFFIADFYHRFFIADFFECQR